MSAIYILILVSLLVALGFLAAYVWAVRGGQYDDTVTPSMRILMDEPAKPGQAALAATAEAQRGAVPEPARGRNADLGPQSVRRPDPCGNRADLV